MYLQRAMARLKVCKVHLSPLKLNHCRETPHISRQLNAAGTYIHYSLSGSYVCIKTLYKQQQTYVLFA